MNFTFVITAGGIGKRMKSQIPKQFLLLKGKPVLMHTIQCFYDFDKTSQLLVTLPKDWWEYWQRLVKQHEFNIPITLIDGGVERYDSIKNALTHATGSIIGIHDGVRPIVSQETITKCIEAAQNYGAAIPVMPLKESLRKTNGNNSNAVPRKDYVSVQTPQCFQRDIILKAYQLPFTEDITDDASLVEKAGFEITLTVGNEENIKITTPIDLKVCELLMDEGE
jgi:2-C-methyl-D-erythritol 4-phosphate cytidylyltransferase